MDAKDDTTPGSSPGADDTQQQPTQAPSPLQDQGASQQPAEGAVAKNAATPTGADDKGAKPDNLLNVVGDALKGKTAVSPAAGKEGVDSTQNEPNPEDAAKKDGGSKTEAEQEAEDAKLPFHNHPRWQQVIKENRENRGVKAELGTLQERFRAMEPYAKSDMEMRQFMQETGLSTDEVAKALEISAMMKSDPAKAREMLSGYMRQLDMFVGEILPEDLQRQVDDGQISVEAAKLAARDRFAAGFAQRQATQASERAQKERQDAQRREQEIQQQQLNHAMNGALVNWENAITQRDPDYAKKRSMIIDKLAAMRADKGAPNTPEEAVQRTQQAYDEVTAYLRKEFAPAPKQPVSPIPSGASSANAIPKPTSIGEVVKLALAGKLQPSTS